MPDSGDARAARAAESLDAALQERAEELYEEAPCGYLSTRPDGTIVKVNGTLLRWIGFTREQLLGRRFVDLLTAGGRIYHETHYAPLLSMQGAVRAIAVEIRCADGRRLPVLVDSVLKRDAAGEPLLIRTMVFDATDRKRYERELLLARDRAREAHARTAEVAHVLQQSLLASVPLRDARVSVGAAYRPAVEALEVGGDWHDAFPLGEDRVGVVVGDVVGRGIEAAATMGQLRSATRALAGAELGGPGQVLARLDRFATRLPSALMATLIYAEVDLGDGAVRFASAGHPPPLLAAPGAVPEVLWDGRSLPLGVAPEQQRPPDGAGTLAPGGRLLLYSDGLVERRGEPLDVGIARLATALREHPPGDPQALVDALLDALADPAEGRDDVCALCVEIGG